MPYNTYGHDGVFRQHLGYEISGTMTSEDAGKAAKGVAVAGAALKAAVGTANTPLLGMIRIVHSTEVTVQRRGYATLTYTGTAPTAGAYNNLECGADGAVQVDDTNGVPFYVESVDTSASTCLVDLG